MNTETPEIARAPSSLATLAASQSWRLVLSIVALIVLGVGAIALYLPGAMQNAAIEDAYRGNLETIDQIRITRGYYNEKIIAKARNTHALTITFDHEFSPTAIPLPATLVKDISNLLAKRDTTLALTSPFPWPHRADRTMDSFQEDAWMAFQADPAAVFSRQETRDGRRILRVAVADLLSNAGCVDCHNSDPLSPRHDWQIGDVRGVFEVNKVIEPYLASADERSRVIIWSVAAGAAFIILVLLAIGAESARNALAKREADRRVRYLAHHDAMTGSLNRNSFFVDLATGIGRVAGSGRQCGIAVHYIDVDHFKEINDRFGHEAGDQLVRAVSLRLRALAAAGDLIARFGGDEFVMAQIVSGSAADSVARGQAIVRALAAPFELEHHRVIVSASVGVCFDPSGAQPAEELLRSADAALYRAKHTGRNRAVLFSQEMQDELTRRRELEQVVREASREERFTLHFQPIFDGISGRLDGFEALMRLPLPDGGGIPPSSFIPVAERIGAITAMGRWALQQACRAAAGWPEQLVVAVNLSPAQFAGAGSARNGLVDTVAEVLHDSGLAPHRLELEVTEGVLLESTAEVIAQFHQLKRLGVTLVLDDFGTGYSSLGYLWKLPFDKLKIDRSFIAASTAGDEAASEVLRTIIRLSRALDMEVTAEGVETAEQVSLLEAMSCDHLQGYHLGRPMPQAEVAGFIGKRALVERGPPPVEPAPRWRNDQLAAEPTLAG